MGIVGAILAFLLGLRLKPKRSGIALVVSAVATTALAIWSRYQWTETHKAESVMLAGAMTLTLLTATLALIGPTFFRRWQLALCVSAALVFGLLLVPAESTMCAVLALCP
ncbi:MAG: hypothetical protein IPL62_12625 [Caulobacteraceae bacterium]|nr:hypothetical protein [Caulobacteraceae bacterium]